MNHITQEYLRAVLDYNQETGEFRWRVGRNGYKGLIRPGFLAGTIIPSTGYTAISLDQKVYTAHRLAFFWVTGEWPPEEVDHIDGNRTNNRWSNLRLATRSQNMGNTPKYRNNTSGHKGVFWHKKACKWMVQIQVQGKLKYLGLFVSFEEACQVQEAAAKKAFGQFNRG